MAEETALENGHISNFEGLMTVTLDQVILHTTVHHSATSTYMRNFIEIKETFLDRRTNICTAIWDQLYQVDSIEEST